MHRSFYTLRAPFAAALFVGLFFAGTPFTASGKEKAPPPTKEAPAEKRDETEIPAGLDYDRRKAVDQRFELSPYGGDYFGDKLNHTFIVGADLTFNFTNMFGIVGNFSWSQASVDRTSALGAIFNQKNEWIGDGGFVVNMPALFRSRKSIIECDLYTTLGAGVVSINGAGHVGGFIGGGMKIRPNVKWFAIRVDIRDYFTSLNNPGGSDFENDLTVRVGPTFLLPPEL
jgi:outer membrane beta-barrel protein